MRIVNWIRQNRVVKNASWLICGKVFQMLLNLAVGLLTARYLGPSNYGLINYAAAYTAFFSSVCNLGLNSILVKELIDNPEKDGEIIGTSLGLKAISSLLSALTIVSISFFVDGGESTTQLVVLLSSIGMIFQIFETFNYWFQSKLCSKVTAVATLIAYTITSAYRVALLITKKTVAYFAIAGTIDYICLALLLYLCYRKSKGGRLRFSKAYSASLLKKSYHFILPGIMVAVYGQTDKIMLKHMLSDAEVGYYATAVTLCGMWCFILTAIIDSLYPTIMEAYNDNKAQFDKRNKLLYTIVFYISTVVSIGFTIFGELVVKILYGVDYLPAAAPLRVITWYTAFSYLGVARNAWIICMNRQKFLKYIYCAAAVCNVALNCIFIPMWGAVGAAIASLVAQIMTTLIVPFFISGMRENSKLMLEAILFR